MTTEASSQSLNASGNQSCKTILFHDDTICSFLNSAINYEYVYLTLTGIDRLLRVKQYEKQMDETLVSGIQQATGRNTEMP